MPARLSEREQLDRAWLWAEGRVDEDQLLVGSPATLLRKHRAHLRRRWLRRCAVSTGRWRHHARENLKCQDVKTYDRRFWRLQRALRRELTARLDYEAVGGRGWVTRHLKGTARAKPSQGGLEL
jgi:hypothetical protein